MKPLKKLLCYLVLPACLLCALAVAGLWWTAARPLSVPERSVEFIVPPGSHVTDAARALNAAGVAVSGRVLALVARVTGQDRQIKAGVYAVQPHDTLLTLLARMTQGSTVQRQITFLEGWSYQQIRAALAAHPDVRQTLAVDDDARLLAALGVPYTHPEGLFFPDTYRFAPGTSDLAILRLAWQAQARVLAQAWAARAPDVPLSSPYEALILASIVEKETGQAAERARVAGVFANRLRLGMRLQTDPTVIYGLGAAYKGRIRTRDLRTDTPWNTYTRHGLPPTPIAAPSRAALWAAVQPERHRYLYFVSRGDGSSAFAVNLAAHNRNVRQYILGQK